MKSDEKYLYIVFSAANTRIGSMIRFFTGNKYSHVSISFDKDLKKMYSFTRYYENTPFIAGFSEESPLRYSGGEGSTLVKVCKIPLEEEKYERIMSYLDILKQNSDAYIYNYFSALLFLTGFKLRIPQSYTCLEFAVHILSRFELFDLIDDRSFYDIADLEAMLCDYFAFEGDIAEIARPEGWGGDYYASRESSAVRICTRSARRIGSLLYRLVLA